MAKRRTIAQFERWLSGAIEAAEQNERILTAKRDALTDDINMAAVHLATLRSVAKRLAEGLNQDETSDKVVQMGERGA